MITWNAGDTLKPSFTLKQRMSNQNIRPAAAAAAETASTVLFYICIQIDGCEVTKTKATTRSRNISK